MNDIFNWNDLSQLDKKMILEYVSMNNHAVREKVRNEFPNLYIGREHEEVAKGWLMIAGLEAVKKYIGGSNDK